MKRVLYFILVFAVVSPLWSTTTRLRSMGNLQIVIDDNTNKIDLFNFGNNPCGLFTTDDTTTIDLDILYGEESFQYDTLKGDTTYTTFGNAIPPELLEFIPTYSRDVFQYLPFITLPTNRLFYVVRNKSEDLDVWGNVPSKQAIGFLVTYGKLNQNFTDGKENAGGPTIGFMYDRLISQNLHLGFEGGYITVGYTGDEDYEEASLSNLQLTPAVSFIPHPSITVGVKMDYNRPSASFGSGDFQLDYSGNAFNYSLSIITDINSLFDAGVLVAYKTISATDENDQQHFSVKGLDVRLKPRICLPNLPCAIGALIDIKKCSMLNKSDNDDTLYEDEYTKMAFGGGPVLDTKYFLLGFEYIYSTLNDREEYLYIDTTKTSTNTIRIGGEIRPFNYLNLRGGYEYATEKQNEPGNREIVSSTIGTGFGILLRNLVLDACYNRIEKKEENIKRTIKDNVYMISIRYIY